ncbi:MAG: ankyrin repeat domain-containing protein [Clostridia bacterium]|nr:ankyrin repeat domain-containing protein [Clostridia bacterium]
MSTSTFDTEVVKLLIEAGADVTADNNYAIITAAKNNHIETLVVLVKAMK